MTGRPPPDRRGIWHDDRSEGAERRLRPRWQAVAGFGGLALACLALGALAFALVAPPLGPVRDRLVDQVKARTGRTVVVDGPMSAALLPRVVVSLGNVAVPAPDGVEGPSTVTVPSVEVETSLLSLISRRPKLERVTLHGPTIELVIDAQGRRSWEPAAPQGKQRDRRAERPGTARSGEGERAAPGVPAGAIVEGVTSVRPGAPHPWVVQVRDATVRYRDERSGVRHEIGGLNLDLSAEGRDDPVTVSGTFTWQGEPWRLSGSVWRAVLEGRPGLIGIKLAGAPVEAAYEGTLTVRGGLAAEGDVSLGRFAYGGVKIGPSRLAVSIDAGIAKATLHRVELYGGTGQGAATLDTTGQAPAFAASLKLTGVSLLPLLGDAAGIGWIDGRGTVALNLTGRGRSEREIAETLQGKVQISVADGAIAGIDIDRGLRALQRGRLDRLTPRREDRTPFSELSGTFDIADGVAKNQDLKLVSANLQLGGEGMIELAPRRIDYTLQTKISSGPPDDGAAFKIGAIELPVSIKGPLAKPEFTIKGQEALNDAIRQIGRSLRSREVQDALKGFLGGDGEKRVKPGESIDKLLKKEERSTP